LPFPKQTALLGNCKEHVASRTADGILPQLPHEQVFEIDGQTGQKVEPMQLEGDSSMEALEARFCFDPDQNVFFADFSGCVVRHAEDVEHVRASLLKHLSAREKKVPAIVNYEGFTVLPDALDAYVDMAQEVALAHYSSVSRYTTAAFLRAKLGRAFQQRGMVPHIFGSERDALAYLCKVRQYVSS
jgi:propionate CoA-transferase